MNNNPNRFLDGFLWGAIIGGGLVFLLATKKGKKILKMISEEGLELSEFLEEGFGNYDEDEGNEEEVSPSGQDSSNGQARQEPREAPKASVRRLFRGVRRKS